ncbi:histidine phosphatase family protein [Aliiroseovarius crassostreae]|uniref:histidine phosphatase family protein n=1 Tax=Aliiroseovarius crassostreae TaxID=154981 RepID=UPI002206FFBC|nr:histidine phosphatase family protein [Aliiroseovarius crassostreae]UWP90008.1 histidine phosphatase family protein [Aliiroseovarius crassostreae]UWQ02658.1 histidine phosphatase family protein [Aliiroseovarius crassostreae]
MSHYPEIYVIRHGQTEWNLAGRHQGRLDSPLTPHGRGQAVAMGRLLAEKLPHPQEFSYFTSPQGRSRATAALALGEVSQPLPEACEDARLCEVAFGRWEGKTLPEIRQEWPELAQLAEEDPVSWHFLSPGGETLQELECRAEAFLKDLRGPSVIFTHGILSRVLRARWLGMNVGEMLGLPGGQGVIFHLSQELGHVRLEK